MFHELLMALSGFVGDVFRPDGDGIIKIRKDIPFPFIHPGEVAIIDEILEIGTMFKYLEDFVQEHQLLNYAGKPKTNPHGLYVTALCNGLRTILDEYLDVIADLELKVIEDMNLTLNHLRAEVEIYRELFASLSTLVKKVLSQEQSSTVIVELVKSEFDEKLHLQDSLQKLIPWINGVLFKQLTNWMVYGTLNDPFNEFFIQPRKPDTSDSTKAGRTVSYFINFAVVPSYFPVSLMDKILFVGMGISILEKSDRTRSIAMEHQQRFHSKMKAVNLETFRLEKLSATIDELAASIGTVLHQIVVNEAGLVKHLGIIKDFYLTGRGELFHDFLSSLKPLIALKSPFMLSALRRTFTVSATRVQLQEEVLQKIELNFPTGPQSIGENIPDYICKLSLKIKHEWPLHIFFTEETETRYNSLFRFLLKVRLLQMDLNMIWLETRKIFRFPIPGGPAELRNIMSFFIDHLQHYLQEDVLENQYSILLNSIEKSETFEQIRVAHANFQTSVLAQAFQTNQKVLHFVEELLSLGTKFTDFMISHIQTCERSNLPINEGISKEIEDFSKTFKLTMELLLVLLKNLACKPQSGQLLGQFLLRLDFNSYFSAMTNPS